MSIEILVIIIITIVISAILIAKKFFSSSLIEKAAKMMDGGSYGEAIKNLKILLNKNDLNSRAHFLMGECYLNLGNFEWAMPEFKTVLKLNKFGDDYPEYKIRHRLADIYLHYNKLEEAQKEFLLMIKLQPNNFINYYQIGKIFQDRGYLDNAYNYYRRALAINKGHLDSLFQSGEISYMQKRYADAIVELQEVLRIDTNYYKAHYYLGMIYLSNKNFAQAIAEFEYSSKDKEFKLISLAQKGRALMESSLLDKAIIELERAKRLIKSENSTSLAIRYYLALCYEKNRRLEMAIELWEEIAKIKPNYQDVQEKLMNYQELRTDDKLKDFLTASADNFLEICKKLINYMGLDVIDLENYKGVRLNIIASESESKWRNTRRVKRVIKIIRTNDIIGEILVREVLDAMKEVGATKGMIITSNKFSRQAIDYAQSRPIDLIDKEGLSKLLKRLDSDERDSESIF